jgi:hypothetical protein
VLGATRQKYRHTVAKHFGRLWLLDVEGALFAFYAGACVLLVACLFYGSLRYQLFLSAVRPDPYLSANDWSAPLDDVFIHFDFARSITRGHPFEWSRGNGYSSGGTSLLYPFVLALGYPLGFRGVRIMQFAAVVACTATLATLLGSRRLFRSLPKWTSYLGPPLFLGVGALDWSLMSGMEVAFFLSVWALVLVLWDDLLEAAKTSGRAETAKTIALGLANGLLVATRPEAIVVAAVFAVTAALFVRRGLRESAAIVALSLGPPFLVVIGQAAANKIFTGDFSAAGALVKLEIHDPRLSAREVWDAWLFHVRYQVARVTGYHVADGLLLGSVLWGLSALPFFFERTRRIGVVLWSQALLWVLVVALNGQVRWQNERYTMPALAWLLLSAAVGVGATLAHDYSGMKRPVAARRVAYALVVACLGALALGQGSRMRDQVWFFGRASRNIRDQHMKVARKIRHELPRSKRVLVGDAGAIPYESDEAALDVVGLGGYRRLPFAKAGRWGIGASLELIERIPPSDRPDILAIYPGWWGEFPLWFGRPLSGVSVRGNVICGGLTKMLYEARWQALDAGSQPVTSATPGEVRVDDVDFGDLISEAAHAYRITGAEGFVAMKILAHPSRPTTELWDAGRVVPPGAGLDFVLSGLRRDRTARLVVRTAPPQPASLVFRVGSAPAVRRDVEPADVWQELSVDIPRGEIGEAVPVTLKIERSEVVVYHAWVLERR